MVVAAPAFLVGILVLFFATAYIIFKGLAQVLRWQRRNSNSFRGIDSKTIKNLGNISIFAALIVTAVVFDMISKSGSREWGFIILFGLSGIGILTGIVSFITPRSSSATSKRTGQGETLSTVQAEGTKPTKETTTKTMEFGGRLTYIVGEPTGELLVLQCPACGQPHAISRAKTNVLFDCHKCNKTIHIVHGQKP